MLGHIQKQFVILLLLFILAGCSAEAIGSVSTNHLNGRMLFLTTDNACQDKMIQLVTLADGATETVNSWCVNPFRSNTSDNSEDIYDYIKFSEDETLFLLHDSENQFKVVGQDGTERVVLDALAIYDAKFSPDSAYLAYSVPMATSTEEVSSGQQTTTTIVDSYQLFVVTLASSESRLIADNNRGAVLWSRGGEPIVQLGDALYDLSGELMVDDKDEYQFANAQKTHMVVSNVDALHLHNISTGEDHLILDRVQFSGRNRLLWTPDGQRLSIINDQGIGLVNPQSGHTDWISPQEQTWAEAVPAQYWDNARANVRLRSNADHSTISFVGTDHQGESVLFIADSSERTVVDIRRAPQQVISADWINSREMLITLLQNPDGTTQFYLVTENELTPLSIIDSMQIEDFHALGHFKQ